MTCEGTTGVTPGGYGFEPVRCHATRGIRRWTDADGREHSACPAHWDALEGRFPMAWPGDFVDHPADATVESEYATYWTSGPVGTAA